MKDERRAILCGRVFRNRVRALTKLDPLPLHDDCPTCDDERKRVNRTSAPVPSGDEGGV